MKKAIFLLATLLATVGFAQTPQDTMPAKAVFDSNPSQPGSPIHQVLTYAIDADNNRVPVKLFKITNNTDFVVYPVLRDGNETVESNPVRYDPYDLPLREYRGYIGYKGIDNKYYFGLQKGQTITIRVPLVFWNAARMGIVTNGQYLTPAAGTPNPLTYSELATCVITASEQDPKSIPNGVVMWYQGPLGAPALDSPDQLVEWTIRDSAYLSSTKILKRTTIPKSEQTTLINYDVSYVDNMFLPIAMEALDVPVPAPPYPPGKNPAPYGWIGSIKKIKDIKTQIAAFTADNNQLLGAYFGGKGWPFYNIPLDPNSGVKIPSAQNVFGQSPLSDVRSSYDNNRFMLSSSDTGAIRAASIGTAERASIGDLIIKLAPGEPLSKVKSLRPGQRVVGPQRQNNPIQAGTTVVNYHVSTGKDDSSTVQLSLPIVAIDTSCTLDFFNPVTDYASEAMVKLWYSWANYYLEQTKDIKQLDIKGAVKVNEATLRFADTVYGLTEGMQVSGPGLDNPDTSKGKGGVIILSIASDYKSVTLSNLANKTHPLSDNQDYHFIKPQPLPETPDSLYIFKFSEKELKDSARLPADFSKKVYLTMAAMAQIPKNPDPNVKSPHVLQLMGNIVGGTMGFMFDTDAKRFTPDGLAISATVRDMIKSVLRGVSDFTAFPESTGAWYPDPKITHAGLKFNAFNLDPFVWFVHVQLGFSGYGFSLDDDTADVGAGQATQLQISIGGENGLTNPKEWTIQAVYGPVPGEGKWDPDTTMSFYLGITNATNHSPIMITSNKHGLTTGDSVTIDQVKGNTAANGKHKIMVISDSTFLLLGSTGNGNYNASTGRWTLGPLPFISDVDSLSVYWKLKGDDGNAGFQGALVEIPGVVEKGQFRVKQLGNDKLGILALNKAPTKLHGKTLPKGTYQWIFSGK